MRNNKEQPVNASAPSLEREVEVQSEIRKVRRFGRTARVVCAAFFGFGLVGTFVMLFLVVLGPIQGPNSGTGLPGLEGVTTAQLTTPQLKAWAFLVAGVSTGVVLAGVYQLYRLFGNLAAGAIYTFENVRRVRHVGLLTLLSAALGIVMPLASAALVTFGFIDASFPINHELAFSSQSLSSIISAGLILLASWIMDVGLYEKDHADALRRDADLVI
jgi:hypothetical protein